MMIFGELRARIYTIVAHFLVTTEDAKELGDFSGSAGMSADISETIGRPPLPSVDTIYRVP